MQSMMFQVRVGDPNRHTIYRNFSDAQPVLSTTNWSISVS
jgi:hypothetical protein